MDRLQDLPPGPDDERDLPHGPQANRLFSDLAFSTPDTTVDAGSTVPTS